MSLRFSKGDTYNSLWQKKNRNHIKCFLFWESHDNISNRKLNFISKWLKYVSLKVASQNNEFVKQMNPISKNLHFTIYTLKKTDGWLFYLNFLIMHVGGTYLIIQ